MMKKLFFLLVLLFLLAGCAHAPAVSSEASTTPETPPAPTKVPVTLPAQPPAEAPTEAETLPPHSDLYIPGVSVEDVIVYFHEVCLDAEFVDSGDPSRLQKWVEPIAYYIEGIPTEEDLETLGDFAAWLNTVEGFPGIEEAADSQEANLRIHFCTQDEMIRLLGDNFYGMDGGVTFWYLDDEIYDAIICYRTDLDQQLRNSVILEEIYNGLGPIQDTALRPDSIIYTEFSQPQALTEMDELILRLLYHPLMECGMNILQCEAVIRQLYY